MATKTLVQCELVGDISGQTTADIRYYPEAASQSFTRGALVYLNAGALTECADHAALIMGIAQEAATGVTSHKIAVAILTDTSLLSLCAYHATAASAITAVADVGIKRPIELVGHNFYIDKTDTTSANCVIIDLDGRDTVGDIYGRYLCTIVAASIQSCVGS